MGGPRGGAGDGGMPASKHVPNNTSASSVNDLSQSRYAVTQNLGPSADRLAATLVNPAFNAMPIASSRAVGSSQYAMKEDEIPGATYPAASYNNIFPSSPLIDENNILHLPQPSGFVSFIYPSYKPTYTLPYDYRPQVAMYGTPAYYYQLGMNNTGVWNTYQYPGTQSRFYPSPANLLATSTWPAPAPLVTPPPALTLTSSAQQTFGGTTGRVEPFNGRDQFGVDDTLTGFSTGRTADAKSTLSMTATNQADVDSAKGVYAGDDVEMTNASTLAKATGKTQTGTAAQDGRNKRSGRVSISPILDKGNVNKIDQPRLNMPGVQNVIAQGIGVHRRQIQDRARASAAAREQRASLPAPRSGRNVHTTERAQNDAGRSATHDRNLEGVKSAINDKSLPEKEEDQFMRDVPAKDVITPAAQFSSSAETAHPIEPFETPKAPATPKEAKSPDAVQPAQPVTPNQNRSKDDRILRAAKTRYREDVQEIKDSYKDFQEYITDFESQLADALKLCAAVRAQLTVAQDVDENRTEELTESRQAADDLTATIEQLKKQGEAYLKHLELLAKEQVDLFKAPDSFTTEQHAAFAKESNSVRARLDSVSKEKVEKTRELDSLKKKIDKLVKEHEKTQATIVEMETDLHERDADIEKAQHGLRQAMVSTKALFTDLQVDLIRCCVTRNAFLLNHMPIEAYKQQLCVSDDALQAFYDVAYPFERRNFDLFACYDNAEYEAMQAKGGSKWAQCLKDGGCELTRWINNNRSPVTSSEIGGTSTLDTSGVPDSDTATYVRYAYHERVEDILDDKQDLSFPGGLMFPIDSGLEKAFPIPNTLILGTDPDHVAKDPTESLIAKARRGHVPKDSLDGLNEMMAAISLGKEGDVVSATIQAPGASTTKTNLGGDVYQTTGTAPDRSKVETENKLFFTSWPTPEGRTGGPAQIRRVRIDYLPESGTLEKLAAIIWGGKIQEFYYQIGSPSAQVLFLRPQDAMKYYNATANGIEYPEDSNRLIVPKLHDQVDPAFGGVVQQYINEGNTRVLRVYNVPKEWTTDGLKQVAVGAKGKRVCEKVRTGRLGVRRTVEFRMGAIRDAIELKHELNASQEWEGVTMVFAEDPCEKAKGVHLDSSVGKH